MKTLVIASTTFRELVRRPLFWSLLLLNIPMLFFIYLLPYNTFGEDIKMVKDQGLATVMLTGLVVALFAASVSIADEIEGKTAITLLSKPIRRRDFIMGKYLGIMAAVALLFLLLSIVLAVAVYFKVGHDAREVVATPPRFAERLPAVYSIFPLLVLSYFQVAILCALSVALSTRLPLHLNISLCIIFYLLGHIAPQMVQTSSGLNEAVQFTARLIATILPGLEYFNVSPAIAADTTVPWLGYVLPCFGYTVLYVGVALCLALLLFEDRDLA